MPDRPPDLFCLQGGSLNGILNFCKSQGDHFTLLHTKRHKPRAEFHGLHGTAGLLLNIGNNLCNLQRASAGCLGQLADLSGNHSKTKAILSGSGRFNRRIQREQIGLGSNFIDGSNNGVDLCRQTAQIADNGLSGGYTGINILHLPDNSVDSSGTMIR
ncbi:hypothetical protein D3C75_790310 [compost metagenome]